MQVARELINKPIISLDQGKELGRVKDLYLDRALTRPVALYLGSDGLLSRKESLIQWPNIITLGQDAVLVRESDCVLETAQAEGIDNYIRRETISGRPVDTPGGTKIGRLGDVVLNDEAQITGFTLSQVFVSGPVAASRAINRSAVVDVGHEDGAMTADLSVAEQADLQVVYEGFFAEPSVVSPTESEPSSDPA